MDITTIEIVKDLYYYHNQILESGDPRSHDLFLVKSFFPVLVFDLLYLFIVWMGPKLMANIKPFGLKSTLIIYNFAMSAFNLHIVYELYTASTKLGYSLDCQPCVVDYHPDELRIVRAMWLFYLSKLMEFADSFFFILRKKNDQLSFLHVFHHSSVFPWMWFIAKYVPSGSAFAIGILNSSVHVIMYFYYGLSACGPSVRKYLKWKKYLTVIQLVQFTLLLVMMINQVVRANCGFAFWMRFVLSGYMIAFLVLFGRFYANTYNKTKTGKEEISALKDSNLSNFVTLNGDDKQKNI